VYRRLMLEERVIQSLEASPASARDPGLWEIEVSVREPEKVDYVLEQIEATIERSRTTPPDPERLQQLQSHRKYAFLLGLDSPPAVAGALARVAAITGDPRSYDRLYATMAAVEPADVQAAAQRLFVDARRTVVIMKGSK
jgi:zinc protease